MPARRAVKLRWHSFYFATNQTSGNTMADDVNPYNAAAQTPALSQSVAGPPPTTADFMIELDDVVALTVNSPASRQRRRAVLISLCCLWVVLVIVGWPLLNRGLSVISMVWLVFALAWTASFSPPLWRWRISRACRKIYGDRLPWQQTTVISSDGIKTITPESEGRHRWQAVQDIATNPNYVFFFLNKAQAIVVPARAFRGEAEFHAFIRSAREFWTAATGRGA